MTVFGVCEKGKYRKENQDSILMRTLDQSGLFIVADGVGGSADGTEASRSIVEAYGKWWNEVFLEIREQAFFPLFDSIKCLAERINDGLCRRYGTGRCCSTLALLFIHKGIYGYLSAGDSRIYCCGRRGTKQITRDDVWENRPGADAGSVHAGKIISAVGGYEALEYSCATGKVCYGDVFSLCSDGIYRYVEEGFLIAGMKRIRRALSFKKDVVEKIAQKAVDNDTKDNYSLIVLKIAGSMEKGRGA